MSKTALITGGTRGIGLGIARCLADVGYNLALCGLRQPDSVLPTLASLRHTGVRIEYVRADVAERDDRQNLLAEVRRHFGRLDVLVNNAGIAPERRIDILQATEESFERLIRVNLQGPYFLTQAAANWMIAQRRSDETFSGCIINISSISATVASVNRGEYCISKAGISMATKLWAARLGEYGISVYEVRPGIIQTDMTRAVAATYDRLIEDGLLVQPRWGTPEDIGKAVTMLARGDLAYATGQVIVVDGGMTLPRL
ncbi:MAG: 3-ketoacyl-ACP reductase [Chloroflexi bacterium]|nr:3-ketoacyl-ACP reductase [Chloroflexota bacterium]